MSRKPDRQPRRQAVPRLPLGEEPVRPSFARERAAGAGGEHAAEPCGAWINARKEGKIPALPAKTGKTVTTRLPQSARS